MPGRLDRFECLVVFEPNFHLLRDFELGGSEDP